MKRRWVALLLGALLVVLGVLSFTSPGSPPRGPRMRGAAPRAAPPRLGASWQAESPETRPILLLRVVDSIEGSSLSGARVTLGRGDGAEGPIDEVTDGEGTWISPPLIEGAYFLTVGKEGHFPLEEILTLAGEGAVEKEVTLEPAAAIRGTAMTETGEPIPEVSIRIEPRASDDLAAGRQSLRQSLADRRLPAETISDQGGRYEVGGLPGISGYRAFAAKDDWVPARKRDITLVPGQFTRVDFVLTLGAVVTGRVTLAAGEPASGAHAHLYRITRGDDAVLEEFGVRIRGRSASGARHVGKGFIDEARVRTDREGTFRLAGLLPGEKWLKVSLHGRGRVARAAVKFSLEKGERRELGIVTLAEGEPSFVGTVRGPGGEPVEGAKVRIQALTTGPQGTEVWTDGEGRYAAWGYGPGEYSLAVLPPDPYGKVPYGETFFAETFPHREDFTLKAPPPPAGIACTLSFPGGVSGYEEGEAKVTVLLFRDDLLVKRFPDMGFVEHCNLQGLEAGSYHLEVSCVGGPRGDLFGRSPMVLVGDGEIGEVSLDVGMQAGTVTGIVGDVETGSPIEGARVVRTFALLEVPGDPSARPAAQETETAPDGSFAIAGLPTDEVCHIIIRHPRTGEEVILQAVPPADLGFIDL